MVGFLRHTFSPIATQQISLTPMTGSAQTNILPHELTDFNMIFWFNDRPSNRFSNIFLTWNRGLDRGLFSHAWMSLQIVFRLYDVDGIRICFITEPKITYGWIPTKNWSIGTNRYWILSKQTHCLMDLLWIVDCYLTYYEDDAIMIVTLRYGWNSG